MKHNGQHSSLDTPLLYPYVFWYYLQATQCRRESLSDAIMCAATAVVGLKKGVILHVTGAALYIPRVTSSSLSAVFRTSGHLHELGVLSCDEFEE